MAEKMHDRNGAKMSMVSDGEGKKNIRRECLDKAIEYTSKDRNAAYGDPEDNFANIAKIWNAQGVRIDGRKVKAADVALMMVGMKLARLRFNPTHEDSWVDIAGYAACGMECATIRHDGKLFVAPLGTDPRTFPAGWTELGYTEEGHSETVFSTTEPRSASMTFPVDEVSVANFSRVFNGRPAVAKPTENGCCSSSYYSKGKTHSQSCNIRTIKKVADRTYPNRDA